MRCKEVLSLDVTFVANTCLLLCNYLNVWRLLQSIKNTICSVNNKRNVRIIENAGFDDFLSLKCRIRVDPNPAAIVPV